VSVANACALCDIAHANYKSAVEQWERLLDAGANSGKIASAEAHMSDCLNVTVRYDQEHALGEHPADALEHTIAQTEDGAHLSTAHVIALFRILREAAPNAVFVALVQWYDSLHAVLEQEKHPEQAAECAIARDGCQATVSALSELAANNEAECEALLAQLRASLAARHVA